MGQFLISPYKSYGDEGGIGFPENGFHFASLCDLTGERKDPSRTKHFYRPDELTEYLGQLDLQKKNDPVGDGDDPNHASNGVSSAQNLDYSRLTPHHTGLIIFMRGFPSPQWLNYLGAAFEIDPEFYFRHLDFSTGLIPAASRNFFYPTPFPKTRDLIQLRVCNTGSWISARPNMTLKTLQERCEISMNEHLNDFRLRNNAIGDSVVRRLMLHDLHNFSIEQRISIEVIYHTRTWSSKYLNLIIIFAELSSTVVVWMDSGRDLNYSQHGPWLRQFATTDNTRLHPVFQHRSRMATSGTSNQTGPTIHHGPNVEQPLAQSIDHVHKNYGSYLKTEVMAQDAFYALNELFEFSAASVNQLLENFEVNISTTPQDSGRRSISELLVTKSLVDDYQRYVKDISDTICARGGPKWPRATQPEHCEKADRAAEQLETRYQRLLGRCDRLSEHFASNIAILMNSEQQRQTERAIEQTDRLSKLSFLAYFFIPLSFATSFYGMNFKELGIGLSIWTYFAMAIPLLGASLVAWFVDVRSAYRVCRNFLKTLHSLTSSWWSRVARSGT